MENMYSIIGFCLGILIGLVIVVFLYRFLTDKNKKNMAKYDERQELERGRGYRLAFYVLLLYVFACGLLNLFGYEIPMDPFCTMLVGCMISLVIMVVYCIKHDAYINLRENPKKVVPTLIMITVANALMGIMQIFNGKCIIDGKLSYANSNTICAIAVGVITLVLIIDRKKTKEDDGAED